MKNKPVYLNMKSNIGVETVDEFTREPGRDPKEFNAYVRKMIDEYRLSGMAVYSSTRCSKDWNAKG